MSQPDAPPPLPRSAAPFEVTHTAELPDLLASLRCSLALTTYQAGKVLVLSPVGERLVQLARSFPSPMGLAVAGHGAGLRLAIATGATVEEFANEPTLAPTYPRQPDTYDALFVPRRTHHTGPLDLHDLGFAPEGPGLIGVCTRFSCLARVGVGSDSFEPIWTPPFVTALEPTDRCHLNGLALDAEGRPAFVTALGATDSPRGWSEGRLSGGVVLDVASGETVAAGLAMPHSPRLVTGDGAGLWVLNSAEGTLCRVDPGTGAAEAVCDVGGFGRGLAQRGDYLFIGVSKIRQASSFAGLPVSDRSQAAGVCVVHAPSGRIAGRVVYRASVEEIYDVAVLPEVSRPGLVGPSMAVAQRAIVAGGRSWWARSTPPTPTDAAPHAPGAGGQPPSSM